MKGNLTCSDNCGLEFTDIFSRLLRNIDTLMLSENLREIYINSGPRCLKHNITVEGSTNSSHIRGIAADIAFVTGIEVYALLRHSIELGVRRIGIDAHRNFLHIDLGQKVDGYPSPLVWMYK